MKEIFLKLKYPEKLVNWTINSLQYPPEVSPMPSDSPQHGSRTMPYKHQKSTNMFL